VGYYWHSLSFSELRQSEAVLPRRSILITNATVITDETVMIAIAVIATMIAIAVIATMIATMIAIVETIDTTTGTVTTTLTKSHDSKATAMACRLAQLMPSVAKATILSDHTSGRTGMTATTRVMGTEASTNRSSVTHLPKAIARVTPVTVVTTDAVTMDDGATAVYGPGK